jgi:putative transposase
MGYVIMPNHIHLIWRIEEGHKKQDVQRDFLKFTSQQIKFNLIKIDSSLLDDILVNDIDRKYQVWERNPFWFNLDNSKTLLQKLNYIHNNPLKEKWLLADEARNYKYSSASFYETGIDEFGFLKRFENFI